MSRLLKALRRIEDTILVLLLTAMIGLAGSQILLRNLFDSSIAWGDPVLRVLVLWVGMLGAMIASQQDKHIRIDLLSRYLPPLWSRHASRFTHLFSALVCALLAWHSGRFVYFEWQDGNTLVNTFPIWIAESILPLGFAVMTLHFLVLLLSKPPQEPRV